MAAVSVEGVAGLSLEGASEGGAIVGALQCQKDSFLKSFRTVVVNCQEDVSSGKKKAPKKYAVEFADTILFPEGGGQPSDSGEVVVLQTGEVLAVDFIKRDGLRAVHLVDKPLEIGTEVSMELNWQRRLDHMQQHTGQHLLSAVLDKHDIPTLSWSMGELINYIELPRALSAEEVERITIEVNEYIKNPLNISVETPEEKNQGKIPSDYDIDKGIIRVIKIGELDANPCCGTHLQSTSQIGGISLLHQTSVRGTNSRLHFLCGDRVLKYLSTTHKTLKQVSGNLSCQIDEVVDKVELLNVNYKKALKRETTWREELANYQSLEILKELESKDLVFYHRSDVALDYLLFIFKKVSNTVDSDPKKVIVLLSGEGSTGGSCIIYSKTPEKSLEYAKILQSHIKNLKGGGKGKWQGKITSFGKFELELTLDHLKSLQ